MNYHRINLILLAVVIFLAVVVQIGWFLGLPLIVQVIPGQAPMQFNTALGFLISGLCGLCLLNNKDKLTQLLSVILLFLGGATLSQYVFGWELGLDNLFLEHSITDKTTHLGRMSPNTAFCFVLVSLFYLSAVLVKASRWKAVLYSLLVVTLFSLSLNTLIAYVFRLEYTYGWLEWTRMAIHTGIAFMCLSVMAAIYVSCIDKRVRQFGNVLLTTSTVYASLLITLTLCLAVRAGELTSIHQTIESRFETFTQEIRRTMGEHLRTFERVSMRWDAIVDVAADSEEAANQLVADFPGLDAIVWVTAANDLRVYSAEFSEDYRRIPNSLEVIETLGLMDETDSFAGVTDSIGWPHIIFTFPVTESNGDRIGTLVFYWRASEVFEVETKGIIEDNYLVAECEGEIIHESLPENINTPRYSHSTDATISIDGMQLGLSFKMTAASVNSMYSSTSSLLFLAGGILSILAGLSSHYYSQTIRRSREALLDKKQIERLATRLQVAATGAELGIWEYDAVTDSFECDVLTAQQISLTEDTLICNMEVWIKEFADNDGFLFKQALLGSVENATSLRIVSRIKASDLSFRHLQFSGASNFADDEIRVVGIVYDISEEIEQKERDRVLSEELKRSNLELEDFARIASHDLQEPLRKIRAFGERLNARSESGMDDKSKDYLSRITSAADRMSRLIQDLLAFSRVTTGAQAFKSVSLDTALADALDNLETSIEDSKASIEAANLPEVEGDYTQLQQLFQNLIGNAIKYQRGDVTPRIQIHCREMKDDLGRPMVELIFEDNGIGFEQEYADRIFEVFKRLHGVSEYAGTGVGLSICKKIVERHGGTLRAESEVGHGSKFYLHLPLHAVN